MLILLGFVKLTGIDLSYNPAGEVFDSPVELNWIENARLMLNNRTPISLAEYANPIRNQQSIDRDQLNRIISNNTNNSSIDNLDLPSSADDVDDDDNQLIKQTRKRKNKRSNVNNYPTDIYNSWNTLR